MSKDTITLDDDLNNLDKSRYLTLKELFGEEVAREITGMTDVTDTPIITEDTESDTEDTLIDELIDMFDTDEENI